MSYPAAIGTTSLSSVYIPEIWSGKMIKEFYDTTVFAAISNTEYEGEIKDMGDKLYIPKLPSITINDYELNMKLTYERPAPTNLYLLIDKGKYFAYSVNDVEKHQSNISYVNKWTQHAMKLMADNVDTAILADIYDDVSSYNQGLTAGKNSSAYNLGVSGTPLGVDKTNVLETIVDIGTVLDEQSCMEESRYIVFPPLFCGLIKKSDLKDASLAGDGTSIMRNGRLGMIDRFEIYRSNNLHSGSSGGHTAWDCVAGHPYGLTFAAQITKNETLRNQDDFGDLVRSLMVYGYKMIKPEAVVWLHAYKA